MAAGWQRLQPPCRCPVGEHQGLVLVNPPGWNRCIASAEAHQHFRLLTPGHQPQDAPRPIEQGIGQRHSSPSLVGAGRCNVGVGDVEHGVSGHKRGGVAVRPQAQMGEVEHRWRPRNCLESPGVGFGRGLQVGYFHRHGIDLLGAQPGLSSQAFEQVREISIRMSGRCRALVHLHHRDAFPGDVLACQARSICHGVRPPLTAMMKRPRAVTAARASAAMIFAACCATASAFASVSIFMRVLHADQHSGSMLPVFAGNGLLIRDAG